MCKSSGLFFILFLHLLFGPTPAHAKKKSTVGSKYLPLYIGVPQNEVLSFLPPGSEFYGDYKDVIDAGIDRETNTIQMIPKKAGMATVSIHDRRGKKIFEYRLEVRKSELTRIVREVRSLLIDIEGISVKIVNNKVVIDGQVLLPNDLNRIYGVIKQYPNGEVDSIVEVSPVAQKYIARLIEREINNPDIEVRAVNGKFVLQGVAANDAERVTAEIIAKAYVPPPVINAAVKADVVKKRKELIVINLLKIRGGAPPPPTKIIQLVVHYVELSKRYLRSSRFSWAPSLSGSPEVSFSKTSDSAGGGIISEFTGIINNLLPSLNFAKQHGYARILESSTVVVQDGKKGVVSSQTQIPYLVRQPVGSANTTQFANVGISTTITPKIVNPRSDVIEMTLGFNVSALAGTTDAGPQVAQNKVETIVSVRSGQSAAVGGLITNTSSTDYNPGATPDAIFSLQASKDFRKNRTQFVVFVTPIIKSSASSGSEKIKRKFRLRE